MDIIYIYNFSLCLAFGTTGSAHKLIEDLSMRYRIDTTSLTQIAVAVFAFGLLLPAAQAKALNDSQIVAIYNQVNSIDIETALVGQVRGHSQDVRNLAKTVASDHTGVRKAVHDLATKIGIIPALPSSRANVTASHYNVIATLRTKSGPEFDRAYLKHEMKFHKDAMDAVRDVLLPATENAELRSHFESVLPHFEHHLHATISVAKKLGVYE